MKSRLKSRCALASHCLALQVPFCLDGPNGVLKHLEYLLERQGHALVCVAEGAGQVREGSDVRSSLVRH